MARAIAAADDAVRVRKERVHTTMLVEVLVLLIFMAMAFAFVTKDESKTSRLQAEIDQLRADLKKADSELRDLNAANAALLEANAALKASLARWMNIPRQSLPANDQPVILPQTTFKNQIDQIQNLKAITAELIADNAGLRRQLARAKGGGLDLPKCAVTPGFLISVTLLGDGEFVTKPLWIPVAASTAKAVPGLAALASSTARSQSDFGRLAAQVKSWGTSQLTPCAFTAIVTENHSNLGLYKRQISFVGRYFYVAAR